MGESTRRSLRSTQSIEDALSDISESDIRAIRNETTDLINTFHKLKESNNNTRRRMVLLQSEFEATKSRLEMLMHRQPVISPDYNAYQIMRKISRASTPRKISHQPVDA